MISRSVFVVFSIMAFSPAAWAYVGPGTGVGALGILIGLVSTVLMALIGLFWYPLKRALKLDADDQEEDAEELEESAASPEIKENNASG